MTATAIDVTDSPTEGVNVPLPPRMQTVADVLAEVRARRTRQEANAGEDRKPSDDGKTGRSVVMTQEVAS